MAITPEARDMVEEVLGALYASTPGAFPRVHEFRLAHERQRRLIDELVEQGYLAPKGEQYVLTRQGLLACNSETARNAIEEFDSLLPGLQNAYREQPDPGHWWSIAELAQRVERPEPVLARTLRLFSEPLIDAVRWFAHGQFDEVHLDESILDIEPLAPIEHGPESSGNTTAATSLWIDTLELTGYRPFFGFSAQLRDLTVIIGANASGKSSLFDFLRFLSFAASNPLPPRSIRDLREGGYFTSTVRNASISRS
ncbi:MAG TPA: AAA family ATPase [Kofleriaceae bacterium]